MYKMNINNTIINYTKYMQSNGAQSKLGQEQDTFPLCKCYKRVFSCVLCKTEIGKVKVRNLKGVLVSNVLHYSRLVAWGVCLLGDPWGLMPKGVRGRFAISSESRVEFALDPFDTMICTQGKALSVHSSKTLSCNKCYYIILQ